MAEIFDSRDEKRGINKLFIVAAVVGIALVGAAVYLISMRPSIDEQQAAILADAFREGSAEYAELNKDIIISTSDKTVESPMGLGTISMFIHGNIRNKGSQTITALEVNAAVVTQFNEVLRERRILVVPVQQQVLAPGQTIPITLTFDGFSREDDRANIRWKVTAIQAQ